MISGFYLTVGNKGYFYRSDAAKRTAAVVNAFIDILAARRNLAPELITRIKADKTTTDQLRREITPATLEKKQLPTITFYTITGANFSANFPQEDFTKEITVF